MSPNYDHAHFETLYAADPDPWDYETSTYEKAKFAMTIGALPRATYHRALELGCSIGVLTERLSAVCDQVTAVDTSRVALDIARTRCPYPHVHFLQAHLPDGDWGDHYDLLVLSEVLYYLDRRALQALAPRLLRSLQQDAHILLVHWTGDTDYPLAGDEATRILRHALPVTVLHEQREPKYRLDLWRVRVDESA